MSGAVTPFPTCQHVVYEETLFSGGTLFLYYLKGPRCHHVPKFQPKKKYFISSLFLSSCKVSALKNSLFPCVNIQQLSPLNRKLNNIFFTAATFFIYRRSQDKTNKLYIRKFRKTNFLHF